MKKIRAGRNFASYAMGDLTIIALRDGHVDLPTSRLRQEGNIPFGDNLPREVELVGGKLRLSVNAYLVIDHGQHVLIDTGAANSWDPTMGLLPEALREAGVDPKSVETVVLTHTHEDHAHGLVAADESDAFPNLKRLFVPREEIPLFDGNERLARFRERRSSIQGDFAVSSNITALETHGHEVGHTAYKVTSGSETLLIWGDIIHVPSIQFARPEITWGFDANQDEARATRLKILRLAAQPRFYVAGAHLDFPGIGTVSRSGKVFRFEPL
jgi:glyoxylase-like metal-dependent hydrolase (beta-lactamase superfamily II)